MGKEYYIVTITNGENKNIFKSELGERIMLKNRTFIVVGETPDEQLPPNIRIERLTKDNKFKLKKVKKLTNK
ncbi:MAG: hypothetical protein J6O56_03180 [Bacilli bacterium]|nr:hypothetical protein [Bacilli bacterium]